MRACVSLIVLFTLAIANQHATAADPKPLPPTYANVPYGPHERNVLDFWKADGAGPRPLLIHIHGGGWVGGDKSRIQTPSAPGSPKAFRMPQSTTA